MTDKEKYYLNEINKLKNENRILKKKISDSYISKFKAVEDYAETYDKLNSFVFLTDKDTFEIVYANKKIKEKYGDTEGKKCWEVFENKTDGPCNSCDYVKIKENFGKSTVDISREYYNQKEKKRFIVRDIFVEIENSRKGRLSIAYDADSYEALRIENKEKTQNLSHILNSVNEAIFVIKDNKFQFVNKATERIFNLKSEELINKSVSDFLPARFKEKFTETIKKISNNEIRRKSFYLKIKDGKNILKDAKAKTEIINLNSEKAILVVLRDITEERKIKKRLKENEKFYKILFEYSPMPVLIYSNEKIVLFNNAVKKYIKKSDLPLLQNFNLEKLVHPDSADIVNKTLERLKNGESFVSAENIKVYNFNKDILRVNLVISKITFKAKPSYIVIVNDISDRIKAEEELKKTLDIKNRFFSVIAHDLRNPLAQIRGFAELLKDDLKNRDFNRIKRLTEYILMSAENGSKLLENLLNWAKSQTGSVAFAPENFNMSGIISEIVSNFKLTAERKNIKLSFIKNSDKDCIFFDKEMFKTILRNLISNAIKYTPKGGTTEVSIYEKKDCFQINVSDTGTGMTSEQVNTILNSGEFFTVHGTENEKGSGLGLAICKDFIKKNNGKLFIETEYGKGSTFSFTAKKCL